MWNKHTPAGDHTSLVCAAHFQALLIGFRQRGRVAGTVLDEDLHGQGLYGVTIAFRD